MDWNGLKCPKTDLSGKFLVLAFVIGLAIFCNCSDKNEVGKDKTPPDSSQSFTHVLENQAAFQGWERYRYQNIVFIHPPHHLHQEKFEEFAKIFSALTRRTCAFLEIEPPDSIVIYFYTGVGHGLTVTQHETPFSDGPAIHFWFPSFYGPPIVKHLLPKWYEGEPRHKFLKAGLIALLDGSTNNYHQVTLKFIDSGTFIPLSRLAVDTGVNVDFERYQSAEAASFVDYVAYAYDINKLKDLYSSPGSFSTEAERILNIPLTALEERWIEFVKTFGGKNTSVKD